MNKEIKEILDNMKEISSFEYTTDWFELNYEDTKILLDYITNLQEKLKVSQTNEETYRLEMQDITKILGLDEHTTFDEVKEYATNLQEEIENLREEDWAWHQTLKAQNNREYRSKFLKEFQKEYNTSTYPDYDEIYKRYDKLLKENERLKKSIIIMEKYLELIHDLGYDYDGLNYEHDLKGLIDEMVRFASLGRACNIAEEIYVDNKGKPLNILGEELKENK